MKIRFRPHTIHTGRYGSRTILVLQIAVIDTSGNTEPGTNWRDATVEDLTQQEHSLKGLSL